MPVTLIINMVVLQGEMYCFVEDVYTCSILYVQSLDFYITQSHIKNLPRIDIFRYSDVAENIGFVKAVNSAVLIGHLTTNCSD